MRAYRKSYRGSIVGWLWLLLCSAGLAQDRLQPEELSFFESRVRPVLIEHCYECHSAQAKNVKGGLRLDVGLALLRGGDSGPAVVPGHPEDSLLVEAIRHESLEMPPRRKLPDNVIADLEKWIRIGAPDPRSGDLGDDVSKPPPSDHWAFQPIRNPPLPRVGQANWPLTSPDYFILKRLETENVEPSKAANRYTWLRRVSLDLTGLPPTVKAIHRFVNDKSPRAHEAVVDRLLASRAFGERWARHWLDLVGYADQVGTSNNVFAEQAWRYRDYVVDSLNHDVPFDQFIREQIAGDLLGYPNAEQQAAAITATGFLVLGDLEIVEADKEKMRVDIVDQQVVKTTRAFLGMTVGCARCHDHKFDPITQRDYYAMAGFFFGTSSVYKTDRGVWSDVIRCELPETPEQRDGRVRQARAHEQKLARWRQEKETAEEEKKALDELIARSEKTSSPTSIASTREHAAFTQKRDELASRISQLERQIQHGEFFATTTPKALGVRDLDSPADMHITIRGNPRAVGDQVPRGFIQVASRNTSSTPLIPDGSSGRRQLADWIASSDNPLTARVTVNRIWQKLFGSGLVSSVDYFGVRSDPPSHPMLLDHLATQFVDSGWSRKALIRKLVLSRAYRMSSEHDDVKNEADPANRLMWRMNRRRLDAESLRDSMLATGGRLLASSGGPALPLEYAENVGGLDPANVNPPSFSLRKWRPTQEVERTLYLPILRSTAQPGPAAVRNMFDFPQPAHFVGQRSTTAVPTQALFLMNSAAVKEHATHLATRVAASEQDSTARLKLLWLTVLNRPLSDHEGQAAARLVASVGESGWVELCRALFATNEFLMTL